MDTGRRVAAVAIVVLVAGVLIARSTRDPYGGAFTGPCRVVTGTNGPPVAELRLTDHGPPIEVGRIAVAFTDATSRGLPTVRVDVGPNGDDVLVSHGQTHTFQVATPTGATSCSFLDWASAKH